MKYQHFTSTIFIVVLRTLSLQKWCIESRRKQGKLVWKSQNKFTITGCHRHYDLCVLELLTAIWYVWLPGLNCSASGCVNVSKLGVQQFLLQFLVALAFLCVPEAQCQGSLYTTHFPQNLFVSFKFFFKKSKEEIIFVYSSTC